MSEITNSVNSKPKKYEIIENEDSTQIIETNKDTKYYSSANISQTVSRVQFKDLSNEDKADIIENMIEDGKKRNEIAFILGISESRISQLVGKKRERKSVFVLKFKE